MSDFPLLVGRTLEGDLPPAVLERLRDLPPETHFYLDSGAAASGTGREETSPVRTLSEIYQLILGLSADQIRSAITVHMRGTNIAGFTFRRLPRTTYPIVFSGEPLSGGEPVTTVEGGNDYGFRFEPGANVQVQRVRTVGFGTGAGILMKTHGILWVEDCVAEGCYTGFEAIESVRAYLTRSRASGGYIGFRATYHSSVTWNNCVAEGNTGDGFYTSRAAVAHPDYCIARDNGGNGIAADQLARIGVISSTSIRNAGFGVRLNGGAEWRRDETNGPMNFGVGTADANGSGAVGYFGVSRDTGQRGQQSTSEYRTFWTHDTVAHTGTTNNTTLVITTSSSSIPTEWWDGPSKRARVKAWGRILGPGNKTVSITTTNMDASSASPALCSFSSTGTAHWLLEMDITPNSGGALARGIARFTMNAVPAQVFLVGQSVDWLQGGRLRLYGQLAESAATIEVRGFELYIEG